MRIDPNELVFESEQDVVNYITKGIVPERQNVNEVLMALRDPTRSVIQLQFASDDNVHFASIMETVYENVATMQKVAAGCCGLSALIGFMIGRRC